MIWLPEPLVVAVALRMLMAEVETVLWLVPLTYVYSEPVKADVDTVEIVEYDPVIDTASVVSSALVLSAAKQSSSNALGSILSTCSFSRLVILWGQIQGQR